MWKLRKSGISNVFWVVLLILGVMTFDPEIGIAREKMKIMSGVVHGDPGDGLGNGGSEGDPVDGLGELASRTLGDPAESTDLRGAPGDSREFLDLRKKLRMFFWDWKYFGVWDGIGSR